MSKTLRFGTIAKYTGSMADDTPQDTTQTQDTTATDQPLVEPPKAEESPAVEMPPEEKTTPVEEPKPEVTPEIPQTPEPPKEEETKPVEETKTEEKPKEEVKPEPETPKIPQPNLDELRVKANKERQDRKQEHLSEIEKLAKSKAINNNDVRELLHVSQTSATRYLEELTKQGKLKKSGKAKASVSSSVNKS